MIRPLLLLALLFPWLTLVATAQPFEVIPTPNPSPDWNVFRSTGGTSDTDVWAVGERRDGALHHILYHWDGTGWSETPAPQVFDNRDHMLFGVSAVAPDAAWAGGLYSGAGSLASGYILRWDGDDWGLTFNQPGWPVSDLWAIAEDDVWAVGITNDVRPTPALALHWNGSSWTRIDPPVIGNRDHKLEAVHASAPDNVWAVGRYTIVGGGRFPYVVRWDGSSWEEVQMPFFFSTTLLDVVTFGPDDTWVAVDLGNVWHWNGSSWTEHAVSLGAFAAVASDDIYGFRGNSVYHWDGASWDLVQTLAGLSSPSFRSGAVALPDGAVWAVGRTVEAGGVYRTLAVRQGGDAGGCEQSLSATLDNPDAAPGDVITFTVTVTNGGTAPARLDLWLDAVGPAARTVRLGSGTLPAGATVTRDVPLRIPANAPAGTYALDLYIGDFAGNTACDAVPFTLTVSGAAPDGGGGEAAFVSLVPDGDFLAAEASSAVVSVSVSPNPFTTQARLTVVVGEAQRVRADVYDALGRRVAVLLDGAAEAGLHGLVFDGSSLPAGVYVVRITGETFTATRRVTLAR